MSKLWNLLQRHVRINKFEIREKTHSPKKFWWLKIIGTIAIRNGEKNAITTLFWAVVFWMVSGLATLRTSGNAYLLPRKEYPSSRVSLQRTHICLYIVGRQRDSPSWNAVAFGSLVRCLHSDTRDDTRSCNSELSRRKAAAAAGAGAATWESPHGTESTRIC